MTSTIVRLDSRRRPTDAARAHPKRDTVPSPSRVHPPSGRRSGLFVGIFMLLVLLTLIGLVMVLSASAGGSAGGASAFVVVRRQAMWLGLGGVALMVGLHLDYRVWRQFALPVWLISVGLLVAVLVPGVGVRINGSARWLALGPLRFQPSELAKLTTIVIVAELLSRPRRSIDNLRLTLLPTSVMTGVVCLLLVVEPDMDTAVILAGAVLAVLAAAGLRLRALLGLLTSVGAVALFVGMSAGYRRQRFQIMQDPWSDELNSGWQTLQSLVSVANGGVTGMGVGNGRGKFGYLPLAHSDFIFAVVAEELGFVGAASVIGLYAVLGVLGLLVVMRTDDPFGRLLVSGIVAWLMLQAFANIGGVLGVLPATGVALPFLSAGGSALIASMLAMGVVLNVARHTR